MRLYYHEHTPPSYEPPGFNVANDATVLYPSDPLKIELGRASTPYHEMSIRVQTTCDDLSDAPKIPDSLNTESFGCSYDIHTLTQPMANEEPETTTIEESPFVGKVHCLCGINETDQDMIQCDACKDWQHTVCSGFFTNNDKRIPKDSYFCDTCKYSIDPVALKFVQGLSRWRRVLFIAYHEGIENIRLFSQRLGMLSNDTKKFIERMEREGFVKVERPHNNHYLYHVDRSAESKSNVLKYFNLDIESYPEYLRRKNSQSAPAKNPFAEESFSMESLSMEPTQAKRIKVSKPKDSIYCQSK